MTSKINWSIPTDDAETKLRIRPLREQWEARGPGLLGQIEAMLPWLSLPREVKVRLIKPTIGGAGRVLSTTEIEFEAVLANPFPMLPEVVRLAWLIAQTDSAVSTDRLGVVAMIPVTIFAAQHVELARLDTVTLECALQEETKAGWRGPTDSLDATQLLAWWQRSFPVENEPPRIHQDKWQRAVASL